MSRLRREEWLAQAQRLPVGGSTRIYRAGDTRPNLVIGNDAGHYWAYHHAGGGGDRVDKTHCLSPVARPPAASARLDLPSDVQPVRDMLRVEQEAVAAFLASKHMDHLYLPRDMGFSDSRKRLIVDTRQGRFGRDMTGHSPQKWITYDGTHYLLAGNGRRIVVVEDLFSWFKALYSLKGHGYTVACALGTRVSPGLLAQLVRAEGVMFFFDGDQAGYDGAYFSARRVHAFGTPALVKCAPEGLDPKDMALADIRRHVVEWTL